MFALLIFFDLQGYTAQAVTGNPNAVDTQTVSRAERSPIAKFLGHTFKNDKSTSPFKNAPDDCSQLMDAVVNCMREGDDEQLYRLFYQPDVNAWVTFYQQITR